MSKNMTVNKRVMAILIGDIHLSDTPPRWRREEPDWFATMKRYFDQLKKLQQEHGCPVLCSGDVFDRWNCSPRLINFAIDNLPRHLYGVPGNHDLPYHNREKYQDSPFRSLVETGMISYVKPSESLGCMAVTGDLLRDRLVLHLCGYGDDQLPATYSDHVKGFPSILLMHRFVYQAGNAFPGAKPEDEVGEVIEQYRGIHKLKLIVTGDHHTPFKVTSGGVMLINTGPFMPREKGVYAGSMWLVYNDFTTAKKILVRNSEDLFCEDEGEEDPEPKMTADDLNRALNGLKISAMNLTDVLTKLHRVKACSDEVYELLKTELKNVRD